MAPQDGSRRTRPRVREVLDARFHTDIMVGPKQVTPNQNVEHGKLGWEILVDDDLRCVWVGLNGQWWTRLGWDQIRYIRYKPIEACAMN